MGKQERCLTREVRRDGEKHWVASGRALCVILPLLQLPPRAVMSCAVMSLLEVSELPLPPAPYLSLIPRLSFPKPEPKQ